MKVDLASQNHQACQNALSKRLRIATVGGVLLLALGARAFYAYRLPSTFDEVRQLRGAAEISPYPGTLHFPLGNRFAPQPNGALYLIAAGNWIGRGSVFVTRLFVILISMGSLVGVYFLAKCFFGQRAAVVALFLASVDRCLITYSCQLWGGPVSLSLVPWVLLLMRRCLDRGKPQDWVLLGLLCGVGWNLYLLFLLLPIVFFAYLLLAGKILWLLKQPWAYVALGLFVLLLTPNVLWNLANQGRIFRYAGSKLIRPGVCPRFAVMYTGDLFLCLRDPMWILTNSGTGVYRPWHVPCHWAAGLFYLACLVYSACRLGTCRFGLLLTTVLIVGAVGTFTAVHEPMHNFWWVSYTLIPAICLTAWVAAQAMDGQIGKIAVGAALAGLAVLAGVFLAGPKWGYFCPEWERVYVGQMLATELRTRWNPVQFPPPQALAEMWQLTDQAIARDPQSVVAWYFRGHWAETAAKRAEAFDRVLQLDPNNALVIMEQADDLAAAGDDPGAKQLLERLAGKRCCSLGVYERLVEVEYRLGHYASAVNYARQVLALDPLACKLQAFLFLTYIAMDENAKAEASLRAYVANHPDGALAAYRDLAQELRQDRNRDKALPLLERVVQADSR